MNRAFLFGNLGCDPDLRYTNKTSTPVLSFSMATHDYSKNETGENVCYTEWHNIIVWGKLAEICKVRLKKADRVLVEGTIKTKSYENAEMKVVKKKEVHADKVTFIENEQK